MHLAIKERQIASEYLAIHDHQIAIAHLTLKCAKLPSISLAKENAK
jgi:hypothetical protein